MDVLNEYKSYIGNYVNDDRANEIVMGSLIFKSQLEDMFKKHFEVNDEASIMLSIPGEELKKEQDKKKEEENKEEVKEQKADEKLISLENSAYSVTLAVEEETIPYNEIISNQVVNYALQFVGNPYVYGGNSLTSGTDCSGFTKLVFANYGVYLPRSAPEQAYAGRHISLEDIMPGDIIVSGYDGVVCHAALYIGDGKLVHALNSNVGIVVTSLYIMPIIDVRRVI